MLGHYTTGLAAGPMATTKRVGPDAPSALGSGALLTLVPRTKVLTTVGPATDTDERLAGLLRAGADAFRLNFSHGTDAEHRQSLRRMHAAARAEHREVAIVADVQGPKIRIGPIASGGVTLERGETWRLDRDPSPGNLRRVGVEIPASGRVARPGDPILLGDGAVALEVRRVRGAELETRVTSGGYVGSNAGLFLPRAHLRTSVLGPKDRADAVIALEGGVDYLALSFVRDGHDIERARRWLDRHAAGREVGIIAKIERAEALRSIDSIVRAADGVMVARGDLGIEVPLERLALEQKMLIRRANAAGRFSIVATQMLLSMVSSPRPTRAEATDVANAVLDGADAVMLSEESAVGKYPIESVRWLVRIADATESAFDPRALRERAGSESDERSFERSVASAAVQLAESVGARAIVTPTHSGRTAQLVAGLRPECPVLALSGVASTRRKLALVRGVRAAPAPVRSSLEELHGEALRLAHASGFVGDGPVVLTAGYPLEGRPTNLVTVVDSSSVRRSSRRPQRRRG